eukprot:COSAG01_NODE_105_length_26080_cov_7.640237_13_plen_127_part_00
MGRVDAGTLLALAAEAPGLARGTGCAASGTAPLGRAHEHAVDDRRPLQAHALRVSQRLKRRRVAVRWRRGRPQPGHVRKLDRDVSRCGAVVGDEDSGTTVGERLVPAVKTATYRVVVGVKTAGIRW